MTSPHLLHDLILQSAERDARATACTAKGERFDYGTLAEQVGMFAAGLQQLGTRRFDRVAVYLPKQLEMVVALFGASLSGGIFVPINPLLKAQQVCHILNDCEATVLVTSATRLASLGLEVQGVKSLRYVVLVDRGAASEQAATCVNWSDLTASAADVRPPCVLESDVVSILYTSGSTGRPKGVVLSHRNMVVGAETVAGYLGNHEQDRILAVLPLSFDAGLSQVTTAFSVGANVVLLDYLLPKDVVAACEQEAITGITGVPPLWMQLAAQEWTEAASSHMRYFANTGGRMPKVTLDRLRRHFPSAKPYLMYGLTEAFRSTYLPPSEVDRRPDSIGKAIPNAEILVLREDGSEAAPHEPGELVHRGPLVAQGYWNDAERTAERFRPLCVSPAGVPNVELAVWSGDMVTKDEEGFLYFIGRNDDMIKTSGYRVSPTELEEAAHASGVLSEAAAIGVEHPTLGQAIVLFAVSAREQLCEPALLAHLKATLPTYMIPHKLIWLAELPRNPNGKIDRTLLRSSLADMFASVIL